MGRNLGARRWQFRWLEPVVSLGREEPYAHLYPAAALRSRGVTAPTQYPDWAPGRTQVPLPDGTGPGWTKTRGGPRGGSPGAKQPRMWVSGNLGPASLGKSWNLVSPNVIPS